MSSAPLFLALLIYANMLLWSPSWAFYKWATEKRMQGKIKYLIRELTMDMETKIKAVQAYRDQYYKALQYQLGDIVYEMRNYFKLMVRIYQVTHRDISYKRGHYHEAIRSLLEVHRMAMGIETKVSVVQGWQYRRETKEERRERMLDPLRMGPPRPGDEHEPLREVAARTRMERAGGLRPRAPLPARPARPARAAPPRGNKKWRHVSDNDFNRIRI